VATIRRQQPAGRFLERGRATCNDASLSAWYDIGYAKAIGKVQQALRHGEQRCLAAMNIAKRNMASQFVNHDSQRVPFPLVLAIKRLCDSTKRSSVSRSMIEQLKGSISCLRQQSLLLQSDPLKREAAGIHSARQQPRDEVVQVQAVATKEQTQRLKDEINHRIELPRQHLES
jgi:hypothetical protein